MSKILLLASSLLAVAVLTPRSAEAATQNCTVTGVMWQKYLTPPPAGTSAVPTDILVISCSDGLSFGTYIGTEAQVKLVPTSPVSNTGAGCYASADGVKAMQSLAVSARLANRPLTIFWTFRPCPGSPNQRAIDAVSIQ